MGACGALWIGGGVVPEKKAKNKFSGAQGRGGGKHNCQKKKRVHQTLKTGKGDLSKNRGTGRDPRKTKKLLKTTHGTNGKGWISWVFHNKGKGKKTYQKVAGRVKSKTRGVGGLSAQTNRSTENKLGGGS